MEIWGFLLVLINTSLEGHPILQEAEKWVAYCALKEANENLKRLQEEVCEAMDAFDRALTKAESLGVTLE